MLLQVQNLNVSYFTRRGEARAIKNFSIEIEEGSTVGIVGESGSGKSTLGLAIVGLVPPPGRVVSGKILFDGEDLLTMEKETLRRIRGRRISMIFQDPMTSLNPVKNIRDHFSEMLRVHEPNVSKGEAENRVATILEELGISRERSRDYPHQFSGGMRQRVMIGLALILNPALVIADEPTTSLDVIVEAQILELLKSLKRTHNLTLILITHNVGLIAEMTDRVSVMYAGQLMELSPTEKLFERPLNPYTQALLQSVPHVMASGQALTWIPGFPPNLLSPPPGCPFHPRCPYAFDKCKNVELQYTKVEEERTVACHLYG